MDDSGEMRQRRMQHTSHLSHWVHAATHQCVHHFIISVNKEPVHEDGAINCWEIKMSCPYTTSCTHHGSMIPWIICLSHTDGIQLPLHQCLYLIILQATHADLCTHSGPAHSTGGQAARRLGWPRWSLDELRTGSILIECSPHFKQVFVLLVAQMDWQWATAQLKHS